ncbi:FHA domain protein [Polystyrenella longa]|uniref:FHA domain protein n=1 Tax=Polystyrenella longa TaxID=2528007 RepID=A0A518CQU1_9PLAN|nr:FHA domain-containing protein [Polystyrenella longa]QDU81597.1 FHA domain protein [Polystyrenella longa]
MKVILRVERGEAPSKRFAVSRNTLIGRSNSCDLRIESDDVSRRHCFLLVTDRGVWVRDLASSNGTQVEGLSVQTGEDFQLNPGSRVSVGPVEFTVHFELSRQPAMAHLGSKGNDTFSEERYHRDETEMLDPDTPRFSMDEDTITTRPGSRVSAKQRSTSVSGNEQSHRFDQAGYPQNDDSGRLRTLFSNLVGWKKNRP